MKSLNQLGEIEYCGIGGENMLKAGLKTSLISMKELSIMGFFQVLPNIFNIKRNISIQIIFFLITSSFKVFYNFRKGDE